MGLQSLSCLLRAGEAFCEALCFGRRNGLMALTDDDEGLWRLPCGVAGPTGCKGESGE